MRFEFDDKEVQMIEHILRGRLGELREQVYKSETPAFHDELKASEAMLRGIIAKLAGFAGAEDVARSA